MERQCGRLNFSPAMSVLCILIALAVIVYVYRHLIIMTLLYFLLAAGILFAIMATVALAVNYYRWQKRRTEAAISAEIKAHGAGIERSGSLTAPLPDADMPRPVSPEDMRRTADWLSNPGTELTWSADGKTLTAKDGDA